MIETSGLAALPHFTISWDGSHFDVVEKSGVFAPGKGVVISQTRTALPVETFRQGERSLVVVGNPVLGEKVDPDGTAKLWWGEGHAGLDKVNGQFLLVAIDPAAQSVSIVNDRFNGIPLYWCVKGDGSFVASLMYLDLFRNIRREPGFSLIKERFLEFIYLQKVLGSETYDNKSHFLPAAHVLTLQSGGRRELSRYWHPDFTKRVRSRRQAGAEFSSLLRGALRRQLSNMEGRRYGLFLSGGHDSRVLLSAFEKPPVCFTVSFSENYEVQCARRAADAVGAEHVFIKLRDDHLIEHQRQMAAICGGMFSTDNALFVGMEEQVRERADILFHGHGFDYLFQGMYLPHQTVQILGRPTFFRRLIDIDANLSRYYLDHVPFRITDTQVFDFVSPSERQHYFDFLEADAERVIAEGLAFTDDRYDLWEYLITNNLGRHYSHPNIVSKMCATEQRTAAFDNDLFDFFYSLTPDMRIDAQVMRYALNTFNPKLGQIPTGNHGIAAGASPLYKTGFLIGRKLVRHLTGISRLHAPQPEDRTWPDRDHYIRSHAAYYAFAQEAIRSQEMRDTLSFFDWHKIEGKVDEWMSGPTGGGKFLLSLISIHQFLQLADS